MTGDGRPRLLFVSPRFLFPVDSGGKIRTTQILRGLKGRCFDITLVSPAPAGARRRFAAELASVCDEFVSWPAADGPLSSRLRRAAAVFSALPVPVATDRSGAGRTCVARALAAKPQVVVFDFPHAAVLAPDTLEVPSVLFTHNVETEIFRRHASVAGGRLARALWPAQAAKMERFETACLRRFDAVVAVADRDRDAFVAQAGVTGVTVIPTGVDLDYFDYTPPGDSGNVVFTGSMDWLANIDGIRFMLEQVWPKLDSPGTAMTVVGRAPPPALVEQARQRYANWRFTGFVDDIRDYVRAASIFVIPLRVGGGTRLKVYEAMAMGCPVVSTTIGVEGLPVRDGEHYLCADSPEELATAIRRLGDDPGLRLRLSRAARELVARNFSYEAAAAVFEEVCRGVAVAQAGARADVAGAAMSGA